MITCIEEVSLRAWPAFEAESYDGWILRFAEGYTKRANSVNPLYPSAIDLAQKISYCEKAYADHRLPTVFKLTAESTPMELDMALESRGYGRLDETSVRVLPLENRHRVHQGIEYYLHVCEDWLRSFARCSGLSEANTVEKLRRIVSLITEDTFFAYIESGRTIIACGLGVLDRGYMGCFDIVVDAAHRGKGYGRRIMEGLLAEGEKAGAETAYLQVVVGNRPAERLYDALGFTEAYRYWYRKK